LAFPPNLSQAAPFAGNEIRGTIVLLTSRSVMGGPSVEEGRMNSQGRGNRRSLSPLAITELLARPKVDRLNGSGASHNARYGG
jgi:hypothetical protein